MGFFNLTTLIFIALFAVTVALSWWFFSDLEYKKGAVGIIVCVVIIVCFILRFPTYSLNDKWNLVKYTDEANNNNNYVIASNHFYCFDVKENGLEQNKTVSRDVSKIINSLSLQETPYVEVYKNLYGEKKYTIYLYEE